MIRTATLALALIALPLAPAIAQTAPERIAQFSLSADGEVRLAPDQATVSAGVVTQGDTAADAVRANARAMSQVFAELRRAGIVDRDIQTSQFSVNPVYERIRSNGSSNTQQRIVGYEARNTVSAMVREIDAVGEVIDALFEAGANTLNGINFSSSEAEAARDEARRLAVANLHARRDLYTEIAGFQIVRILNFSESGNFQPQPMAMMARTESAMFDASTPIAGGELVVRASVNATWEIEG